MAVVRVFFVPLVPAVPAVTRSDVTLRWTDERRDGLGAILLSHRNMGEPAERGGTSAVEDIQRF